MTGCEIIQLHPHHDVKILQRKDPNALAPDDEPVNTRGFFPWINSLYSLQTLATASSPACPAVPIMQTVPDNTHKQAINELHQIMDKVYEQQQVRGCTVLDP